ncbi:TM2 domain-containing protein [Sutcliffiella cohnii]
MSNLSLKQNLTQEQLSILSSELEHRRKSKLITFLLWFFLGMFGVHRFYLGDFGLGIALLLLGWLTFGIWNLIDGIYCLVKRVDEMNSMLERKLIHDIAAERQHSY